MAPNSTHVNRFVFTKRCLKAKTGRKTKHIIIAFFQKVFRSLRAKKPKQETVAPECDNPRLTFRRETFYLSSTSLDKRRMSEDSQSIDTIITLLEDSCSVDNRFNEKLEHNRTVNLIEALV